MKGNEKILLKLITKPKWTASDFQWLSEYIDNEDTSELRRLMQAEFFVATNHSSEQTENAKRILEVIHSKIAQKPTVRVFTISWWKTIAAAAVLFFMFISAYHLFFRKTSGTAEQLSDIIKTEKDIMPGGNKAVLTLSDGSYIILDSAQNGKLAQQDNANVIKLSDGQLNYNSSGESKELVYNTISTPKGGQYQLTLSDGTRVWLNAASSIKFPVVFNGNERRVVMTGEAYFEVAKNEKKPFIVQSEGKQEVTVIGTSFNINAYDNENTLNTTLVDGKVKLSTASIKAQYLTPGQQSSLTASGEILLNRNPDIEEVLAWKNGRFDFGESMEIKSVMRQLERWYSIDVEYKGQVDGHIGGAISRNVNISIILKMLEMTGALKFEIQGNKVIVKNLI